VKLSPNERLSPRKRRPRLAAASGSRRPYRVSRVLEEGQWYTLYEGVKVLYNFNFKTRELEEVAEEECLRVF